MSLSNSDNRAMATYLTLASLAPLFSPVVVLFPDDILVLRHTT